MVKVCVEHFRNDYHSLRFTFCGQVITDTVHPSTTPGLDAYPNCLETLHFHPQGALHSCERLKYHVGCGDSVKIGTLSVLFPRNSVGLLMLQSY